MKEQLQIETDAKNIYEDYIKRIKDKKINETISHILGEELKHITIVNNMIKIVDEYKTPLKGKTKEEKKKFNLGDVSLATSKIDNYMNNIMPVLKFLMENHDIIYISYNKIPKHIKKVFSENSIDINKIQFINCVQTESLDKKDIYINPADLTKISISLNKSTKKLKNSFIIVDSISGF